MVLVGLTADDVSAIVAIVGVSITVGAVLARGGRRYMARHPKPTSPEITEVKGQLTDIRELLGKVSETLTGRTPTALEPEPPMGLVGVVLRHGEALGTLTVQMGQVKDQMGQVEEHLGEMAKGDAHGAG